MTNPLNLVPSYDQRHFPEKLQGDWSLVSLDEGTCCFRAARYFSAHGFAARPAVVTEPTFYAARNRAANLPRSILLLPCVHEICSEVYTSERWQLLDSYIFHIPNPPLYLARARNLPSQRPAACATIPRLRTLLEQPEHYLGWDFIDVDTTQQAAKAVAEDRRCGYCITNYDGKEKYGLDEVAELKRMIMGWYPFVYSPAAELPAKEST